MKTLTFTVSNQKDTLLNKIFLLGVLMILSINSHAQFFYLDGPDAPEANVSSNGQNFVFDLYNATSSNNYLEEYVEYNPNIPGPMLDSAFRFQGYLIYQIDTSIFNQAFINSNYNLDAVLTNPSVARLIGQSDISDTNTIFINHIFDSITMQCNSFNIIPTANNSGIEHHFETTTDAFTGNPFISGNTYCFITLSYAVHNFNYDQGCNPFAKPVIVSIKGPFGGIPLYCLDLATMSIPLSEIQSSKIYFNQKLILETSISEGNFQLFTVDGKLILSKNINSYFSEIDIQNLTQGIYYYQLRLGNEYKTDKIFIPAN